jgi:hypothetical protein
MSKKAAFVSLSVALAIFAVVALPSFIRARNTPASNACVNNLRQLDGAKDQWRLENHKTKKDVPAWQDLLPYLREKPICPQGGTYLLGPVGEPPRCSLGGSHALPQ